MVALLVYNDKKSYQQNSFEAAFLSDSYKVLDSFHQSIERIMDSGDTLSIAYTSYAKSSGSTFPNVTLPDYQFHTSNTRIMSEACVFNYQPIVTDETRKGWEAYVIENRNQFVEAVGTEMAMIQYQDSYFNKSEDRSLQELVGFMDTMVNYNDSTSIIPTPEDSGPYLPLWQQSPAIPFASFLNFNILSHPDSSLNRETMYGDKAVIFAAANFFGESGVYSQYLLSLTQFRQTVDDYLMDPTSPFSYPVFDSFDPSNRTVVGWISSTFYWKLYLENILPENNKGIICVLSNKFNQTFTYRIDGSVATYMGVGDLHDPKYDYMQVTGQMETYLKSRSSAKTKSYTVVELDTDFNQYTLRIYPSQDAEGTYVNNEPAIMALIIVCVFVFTSLVFITYDLLVARRQRIVMNRAVASSAIVSSLFPSQVRENIYRETEAKSKTNNVFTNTSKGVFGGEEDTEAIKSSPNAVLFQDTTIMFADMVGFTAWSASRSAVEVFGLLEAVYHEFDLIAERRKVFKVETIGDCYVAVAGIPNPQPDHAIIMARFAEDCIGKMRKVTSELATTMGPDTAGLLIRIGLHSGAVMGGVLRGKKARFQLFGDAMNTASRMESTGVGGKIHISEETANSIKSYGKTHWMIPRDDKVTAKGKGEMNTFWLSIRKSNTNSSTYSAGDSTENYANERNDQEDCASGMPFEV